MFFISRAREQEMMQCATLFCIVPGVGLECPVLLDEGLEVLDWLLGPWYTTLLDRES